MTALDELREVVKECTKCSLHATRTQTVFDRGSPTSPIMLIGEAPGKEEDKQGEPYVGRAGIFLTKLLQAAKLPEDQIYVCNVLKCRPPKNKFPEGRREPIICRGHLLNQIKLVNPKAIILTGKMALRYALLHGTQEEVDPFMPWVNKQFRRKDIFGDTRFLVVYHPSYLMRRNDEIDMESWISAVAGIWSYAQHKASGTAPAPVPFKEIRPAPVVPRQRRNLFAEKRDKAL